MTDQRTAGVAGHTGERFEVLECRRKGLRVPSANPVRATDCCSDVLVALLPSRDAADGRRIVGMGRIGAIAEGGSERLVATYDRYLRLAVPATFEELGGDPRRNRTISINPLGEDFVQRLLAREGIASLDALPPVANELTAKLPTLPTPSDDDLRELLHDAVVKDLLGPPAAPTRRSWAPACVTATSSASSLRRSRRSTKRTRAILPRAAAMAATMAAPRARR